MAEHRKDNSLWTPETMIRSLAEDPTLKDAEKALVIMLNVADGKYDTRFRAANMKISEIVALLEIMKLRLISQEMGA